MSLPPIRGRWSFCVTPSLLFVLLISPLVTLPLHVLAATAAEWQSRTVYQLLTDRFALPNGNSTAPCADIRNYCGGTFQGIIRHLDYIQTLGFDAIWISPIVKNKDRGFHGYWATDIYTINEHFGTAQDLKDLSAELHRRGMLLMVDVVANHMSDININNVSSLVPFNQASDYHNCSGCDQNCNINQWTPPNRTQIEHCRLSGLLDLDQDNVFVRKTLIDWIHQLVTNFSVDGLRIDTFHCVKCEFWKEFTQSAGVFSIGEVDSGDVSYVGSWQPCGESVLSYPLYFEMQSVFARSSSMKALGAMIADYQKAFVNPNVLGVFADNHDNPRFLSLTKDGAKYRSALAYVLTSIGVSIVYYGTEQGFNGPTDPYDREPLWTSGYATTGVYFLFLQTLNRYRAAVKLGPQVQTMLLVEDNALAFSRGNSTLVVLTNQGTGSGRMQISIAKTPFAAGTVLTSVLPPLVTYTVSNDSSITVELSDGEPMILTAMHSSINHRSQVAFA